MANELAGVTNDTYVCKKYDESILDMYANFPLGVSFLCENV